MPGQNNNNDSYDWIPAEDQSNPHTIRFDQTGVTRIMRDMQHKIPSRVNEPVQNAIDSSDEGVPNTITINIGQKKGEIPLSVHDDGPDGIMKDYNGQITAFIEDQKAVSRKKIRERKGIGMSQYVEIAPYVIIYTRNRSFMHRFVMIPHPANRDDLAFCNLQNIECTEANFKKYNLLKPGTRVEFHTKDDEPLKLTLSAIRKTLSEKWSYRLYERYNYLYVEINGKRLEPTDDMIKHPPRFICALKGGYQVTGAIWADSEGNGNADLFVNGYRVESGGFWGARQFKAYFQCNAFNTDSSRNNIDRDQIWENFKAHIKPLAEKFRETDQLRGVEYDKLKEYIKKEAIRALGKLLPRISLPAKGDNIPNIADGRQVLTGYQKSTDLENGLSGYQKQGQPQEGRVIETRVFNGRNTNNEGKIEESDQDDDGKEFVKKGDKRKKRSKKDRDPPIESMIQPYSTEKPMFIITQLRPDGPVTFITNTLNEEFLMMSTYKYIHLMIGQWMGELAEYLETKGTDEERMLDEERMILSRMRVKQWKSMGLYPSKATGERKMTKEQVIKIKDESNND